MSVLDLIIFLFLNLCSVVYDILSKNKNRLWCSCALPAQHIQCAAMYRFSEDISRHCKKCCSTWPQCSASGNHLRIN